jgi:hypothetical protein
VYDATWFNTEMDKATYDYVLRESYNSDWLKQPHRTELDRGYDMYRKHVEDQISLIEEELVHLCEGLPLLPNLEQVCIRDWWTWEYGPYEEESNNTKVPLSRYWNDLWLKPNTWLVGYRQRISYSHACSVYHRQKHPQSFVIHPNDTACGMSCRISDLRSREFTHSLSVFRNLRKLVLHLDCEGLTDVNARGNSLAKLLSAAVTEPELWSRLYGFWGSLAWSYGLVYIQSISRELLYTTMRLIECIRGHKTTLKNTKISIITSIAPAQ